VPPYPGWQLYVHACNDVPVTLSASLFDGSADDERIVSEPSEPTEETRDAGPNKWRLLSDDEQIATGVGQSPSRLLVVSHPAVVNVNQEVYRELKRRGWGVTIVLPNRWRNEYSQATVNPQALEGMESSLRPTRVAFPGRVQRHVYLTSCRSLCARVKPDVAFVEEEPYSLPATQWGRAFKRLGIPFGVQCYENIDRDLPLPARWLRSRVLHDAAFVAARSDSAARLARAWGATGEVELAPPAVPSWDEIPAGSEHDHFTVGFAGRLIERKGLRDLLEAVRRLDAPVELLMIGNGELRSELDGQLIPGSRVRILDGLSHDRMPSGYSQLDVLVMPSHTTNTWKEQFGRAIVEALWCGVPVVGSDSGEIPWLIGLTEGGLVFPEGDVEALAALLARLRDAPQLRRELAASGRAAVERMFSVPAATDRLEHLLTRAVGSRGR
jgi:glycosyltransferase involved in cell wall biosynthesis